MKEEQLRKKKVKISDQLKEKIKKKPYAQEIGGIEYAYSILKKKNQKFIFSNQRFVLLSPTSFGYASKLPDTTLLPFEGVQSLPVLKKSYSLQDILKASTNNDVLIVDWDPQINESRWEFICENKGVAIEWKKLINEAQANEQFGNQNKLISITLPQPAAQSPVIPNPRSGLQSIPEYRETQSDRKSEPQVPVVLHQETVSKPISSFFVGGIAVENAQIQSQLKSQIGDLGLRSGQIRQQYLRKKREEESAREEADDLGVSSSGNRSPKKQHLGVDWAYEWVRGEDEPALIQRFKVYAESLLEQIVSELGLEERRRELRPVEESVKGIRYEVDGVVVELPFAQLSQGSAFEERSSVVSSPRSKELSHQFKNWNFVLQSTRNRGRIRVPLAISLEYRGFVAFVKAQLPEAQGYQHLESLRREISLLERETRISSGVFQEEASVRLVPVDPRRLQKLSRSQDRPRKFDLCCLQRLTHYLPQDFFAFSRPGACLRRLRPQLIQDEEYDDSLFHGGDLANVTQRLKIPGELREAVNILTRVSESVSERAQTLVTQLQNLDQTLTDSHELANLLHLSGLNVRYLGLLLERCRQSWLQGILMSQVAARCCKGFLRFDLQQATMSLRSQKVEKVLDFHVGQVLIFLNRLFGNSQESSSLWRQLVRQAQTSFQCVLKREYLNIGFFLQSLQQNCRFRLRDIAIDRPFFKSNNIFTHQDFQQFVHHSKTFDLGFTELYRTIEVHLKQQSAESFDHLRTLLNLEKRGALQSHFKLGNNYHRIVDFLINWLSPGEAPYLYLEEQHLPNRLYYSRRLTEIKWLLKTGKISQAEQLRDKIVEHVEKWLGSCHPILTELHQIFSQYFLSSKQEEKKAVNCARAALKNQERLLGASHIKLADGYYSLADVFLHYGKRTDALNSYRKAQQILTSNDSQETEAYGQVSLRIGQLLLAANLPNDAQEVSLLALSTALDYNNNALYLSAIQLISRCFQVTDQWTQYVELSYQAAARVAEFRNDALELQRLLKVIFLPLFHQIAVKSRGACRQFLTIITSFPDNTRAPNAGYTFLRDRIDEKSFPLPFMELLNDIDDVLHQVDQAGLAARWKGFDNTSTKSMMNRSIQKSRGMQFLSILQALNSFLSGHFIEGIFTEQQ